MVQRIKSIAELKRLASDGGLEVAILFMGGYVVSIKFVNYNKTRKRWRINNYIDGHVTSRLSDTNIKKAITKGALIVR